MGKSIKYKAEYLLGVECFLYKYLEQHAVIPVSVPCLLDDKTGWGIQGCPLPLIPLHGMLREMEDSLLGREEKQLFSGLGEKE